MELVKLQELYNVEVVEYVETGIQTNHKSIIAASEILQSNPFRHCCVLVCL